MKKYIDTWSLVIILITLVLFTIALFVKGFTHDLLLEAGVFLVSVKIIMLAYKTNFYFAELITEMKSLRKYFESEEQKKQK